MSARWRLTLSYAGFLLVAGAAMLALLFYLLRFVPTEASGGNSGFVPGRDDLLAALWPRVWQVLAVLAVVGLGGGWILAGRMLRPLRRMNEVARAIAAGSLEYRVRLRGPHDEFRELADTVDSMLDRLQSSFDEQGRFAANAAHELRTPYAITRSMLDIALADPAGRDVDELLQRLDRTNRRGMDVVEALLSLAALAHGAPITREPVDLAETVYAALEEVTPLAIEGGIAIRRELGEGDVDGSEVLIRQLVVNLVLNGIRHNSGPGGSVTVATRTAPGGAVMVRVVNTGPLVSAELLRSATEPFVRGDARTSRGVEGAPGGSGLGLAIVASIADAHGARVQLEARPQGGLDVQVLFPVPTG